MLVSHCTSSPHRLRRGRHWCTSTTRTWPTLHNPALAIQRRSVSLLTVIRCSLCRYSLANVGPNPRYTGSERIGMAPLSPPPPRLPLDSPPTQPPITRLVPFP